MNNNEVERRVIENYENDEKTMILIFAQWCINNDVDPKAIYKEAYPDQMKNGALTDALSLTVSKQDSDEIPDHTLLELLQVYGNDDLAFEVHALIEKRGSQ